jgi:LmbE family N-acetylglucosaminyl deacetylase
MGTMPRTRILPIVLAAGAAFLFTAEDTTAARRPLARARAQLQAQPPIVSSATRLLVIAPHPDDEVLGAGGFMQHVHEAGGTVKVVYLTNGDGYKDGVKLESHKRRRLSFISFRSYGKRRQKEARSALKALGLDDDDAIFVSFPDTGLDKLIRTYWSDRRRAYTSPYTRLDRPPASEAAEPDTEYRGEDLTQELARIVGSYRPTIVLVPRREDQHTDHCAAWYFVADAIGDVRRVDPSFNTDVLNYIVHYNSWPFDDDRAPLPIPAGLSGGTSGWIRVPLTAEEMRTKKAALHKYRTQVHAMEFFLDGFVRSTELFTRPAPARVVLPLKHNPCW